MPAAPGQRAPIADQDVYSVGGSAGVSGLGGDAAKVKYDGELRGGRTWSVPGKDGQEGNAALRSVDGGATVRAGAGGVEAVHGRAQVSETTADGTRTTGGVRGGWDAVRGTGTVGGSIGRTGADGSGGGIEADIVVGNGTTGGKVGGHVTGKNGQRVGGSVGGSETWRVSPPRRDGDAWVVDVVQASTAEGGLGGGKNALQVGAGASGFESRTISRRFPTQAAAAAFQAKLESVPPMRRDAELAALSDPTMMNVGDTTEKASGSGGGAQVGVQGGIVSISVGGQVSGSQTLRFKKLDANTVEVRIGTVASKGGNAGGGTAGGKLEFQKSDRNEQVDVVLVDLRDPKSEVALATLEEGGIEMFLNRHGDGQGKLWRWSQRHTKTTTTEGRSAAVLGLSAGQTGSVEQSRTEDGEGNLQEGVKGTGKQDVAMFGAHHSKSGAVDVTHENGELHGVTLTANAQSSRSGDTARAMGSMLGVQGGDTKGAEAATLTASTELSDVQLRLLWEICKTSGTVTLPGSGER